MFIYIYISLIGVWLKIMINKFVLCHFYSVKINTFLKRDLQSLIIIVYIYIYIYIYIQKIIMIMAINSLKTNSQSWIIRLKVQILSTFVLIGNELEAQCCLFLSKFMWCLRLLAVFFKDSLYIYIYIYIYICVCVRVLFLYLMAYQTLWVIIYISIFLFS